MLKVKVFVIGSGSNYTAGCTVTTHPIAILVYVHQDVVIVWLSVDTLEAVGDILRKHILKMLIRLPERQWQSKLGVIVELLLMQLVVIDGKTAVTATAGQNTTYTWSCTSNSTARDNSNDNPIAFDFSLPRCGYANYIHVITISVELVLVVI